MFPPAPRKTLLVVEDDPNYAQILEFALERANLPLEIEIVHNGTEAVSYLSRSTKVQGDRHRLKPLPDLILTDINMPQLSGLELLAWIREQSQLKNLPVVVMSGYIDPLQIEQINRLGAKSYFIKPLTIQELLDHLQNAIGEVEADTMVPAVN